MASIKVSAPSIADDGIICGRFKIGMDKPDSADVDKPTWRLCAQSIEIDPTRKSGMHRNNQDSDDLQLVFGSPRQLQSPAGAGTQLEHSIGGHGAQFRFYLPAECPDGADVTLTAWR